MSNDELKQINTKLVLENASLKDALRNLVTIHTNNQRPSMSDIALANKALAKPHTPCAQAA